MLHNKYIYRVALMILCLALSAMPALAALNAYLTIKGQKQGEIKGSSTQKGHEHEIEVISVQHDIVSPRDAQSGLSTGKRMHKPIAITVAVDASSPKLHKALAENEMLNEVVINFVPKGDSHSVEKVTLQGAHISTIKQIKSLQADNRAGYEEIQLIYQKMTWTYEGSSKSYESTW